jgi:predicted amidohydrolase YtcJ
MKRRLLFLPMTGAVMKNADLVIINGEIVTMDPLFPRVQALAVRRGKIMALGTDDEIKARVSDSTRVIDAEGRLVLPGFQDTHIHLQDSGFEHSRGADLETARTTTELQMMMREQAHRSKGEWVNGTGWYTGIFTDENLTRYVLDEAVRDKPCFIYASDGHNACLNSKACDMLCVVKGASDPPNGHFVRDARGEPTGMLHEDAVAWAKDRMPHPTDGDFADGVRYGQALCNRHGITGVLDALVQERHVRVYDAMRKNGDLTVRIAATARVEPSEVTDAALARVSHMRLMYQSDMFKVHSAKFFLDGVLENRTAAMLEPYSDAPGGNAPLMFGHNQIKELFTAFDAARFQLHVHVTGPAVLRLME